MKLPLLVTTLVAVICALAALWFFSTFERATVEIPASFEGEARFNDFLAAELLLEAAGIEADGRASLDPLEWLPATTDSLFVQASPTLAATATRERLLDWVVDGGHLLLAAPAARTLQSDDLFLEFSVRLIETPLEPDAASAQLRSSASGRGTLYSIDGADASHRFELSSASAYSALTDDAGIYAARLNYGSGYVTVIADAAIFDNRLLAMADHGRLLLDIAAGSLDPGTVWFVYDASFPPLLELVWQRFAYFVVALALAAGIWLWSVVPRFGPPLAPDPRPRRSILEHVTAAARFAWRHDGAAALVGSTADGAVRRAELRHPGIARLPSPERENRLAAVTGLPAAHIDAALSPAVPGGPREFIRRIRALQTMRKHL